MKRIMWPIFAIVVCLILVAGGVVLFHPAFGRTPCGARLDRVEQSQNWRDGGFQNIHETPVMTGDKSFWQSGWYYLFNKPADITPKEVIPSMKTDLNNLNPEADMVVWLGHSSLFIQQDGLRILVDPVLTNEFPASLMLKPFKGTGIYTPDDIPDIDILLITHDHWDHLDYGTVKRLRHRVGQVICPLGVGGHFERWKYPSGKVTELDWHDSLKINSNVTIKCLPARHFSGRTLTRNKTLWAGYMIDGNRNVYISGDGGYDTHFKKIAKEYPHIDLAIMENGQYNLDWKYIHLLPEDLVKAVRDLSPKAVMGIHNSKFALSTHSWREPIETFEESSKENKLPSKFPLIGETLRI